MSILSRFLWIFLKSHSSQQHGIKELWEVANAALEKPSAV
jgi:hypothetical protein